MITTNYSVKNQPAFGSFNFHQGAKDVLAKKIKTKEALAALHEIVEKENGWDREIYVSNRGSRLEANVGDGNWKTQGFFEHPLHFLSKMVRRADDFWNEKTITDRINDFVSKL